jgi:hypothetical protein
MSKAIFKFECNCGRAGTLHGLFVAKKEDVDSLIKERKHVYFGEVLGKHSEIEGTINKREIKLISEDKNIIKMVSDLKMEVGYNPLDYVS